jgi:hypothetical protein
MPYYGYSRQVVNEFGPMELREVTFSLSADELRRVAKFLSVCADRIENGDFKSSHLHIDHVDREWPRTGQADIIVLRPEANSVAE